MHALRKYVACCLQFELRWDIPASQELDPWAGQLSMARKGRTILDRFHVCRCKPQECLYPIGNFHLPQECMLQTVHTVCIILPTLLREEIGYKLVGILMLHIMTVSGR